MARHVDRPVRVETGPQGLPARFLYRGRLRAVRSVVDSWRYAGAWWDGEGERTYYRVEDLQGNLYDLYWRSDTGDWVLYKVLLA